MTEAAPEQQSTAQAGPAVDDFTDVPAVDYQAEAEKWKRRSQEAERRAKGNSEAAKRLATIEESSKSELEKAVDQARKEGEQAALTRLQGERVLDRIEVLAAKTFADPEDARLRLQSRIDDLVDGDGAPNSKAIGAALERLLKDKPHLAAGDGRPQGRIDQGARPGPDAPQNMNTIIRQMAGYQ